MYVKNQTRVRPGQMVMSGKPGMLRMGPTRWPRPFGDDAADLSSEGKGLLDMFNPFASPSPTAPTTTTQPTQSGSGSGTGALSWVSDLFSGPTPNPPKPGASGPGMAQSLLSALFPPKPTTVYVQQPGMSTTTKIALIGGGLLLVALVARK